MRNILVFVIFSASSFAQCTLVVNPVSGRLECSGSAAVGITRNVVQFGAKGDGVTDDSAAFNACTASVSAIPLTCVVPNTANQNYLLKQPWVVQRGNTTILGQGARITNGSGGGFAVYMLPATVSGNTVPLQTSLVTGPGNAFTLANGVSQYWLALSDLRTFVWDIDNTNNWVYVDNVPSTSGITVTGSLGTPGTNTLSFSGFCPLGVNGTDTGHSLFVNDITGPLSARVYNSEKVLITGGTCTTGLAGGGTLIVTTAKAHAGSAWSVQNANPGLGAFTLESYVKVTNGHTNAVIMGTHGRLIESDSYDETLKFYYFTGNYRWAVKLGGTTYTLTGGTPGSGPGGIDHVAVTYDGAALTLWVNGVSAATAAVVQQYLYIQPWEDFWLGAETQNFPAGAVFASMIDGAIDSIRFSKVSRYSGTFTPTYTKFLTQPAGPTPQSGYSSDANTLALLNFDQQFNNLTGVYTAYGSGIGYVPWHGSNWFTQTPQSISGLTIDGGGAIGSCLMMQGIQGYTISNIYLTHCFDGAALYDNDLFGKVDHVVNSGFANYSAEKQFIGGGQRFGILQQNTYTTNIVDPEMISAGGWPIFASGGTPLSITGGYTGGTSAFFNFLVSKTAANDNQQTIDGFTHLQAQDEGTPMLYGNAWPHNACMLLSNLTSLGSQGSLYDCTYRGIAPIYWDGGISGVFNGDVFKGQAVQPYAVQFGNLPSGKLQFNQPVLGSLPGNLSGAAYTSDPTHQTVFN